MKLFSGEIEPADIGQGQLGDCWLVSARASQPVLVLCGSVVDRLLGLACGVQMTALACLSEFPGAIQNIFETEEYNDRGRYLLRGIHRCHQIHQFTPSAWIYV